MKNLEHSLQTNGLTMVVLAVLSGVSAIGTVLLPLLIQA